MILSGPVYNNIGDYTFLVPIDDVADLLGNPDSNASADVELTVKNSQGAEVSGRGIICRSFGGGYASVTIRVTGDAKASQDDHFSPYGMNSTALSKARDSNKFMARDKPGFAAPLTRVVAELSSVVFEYDNPDGWADKLIDAGGVILLCGRTSSGKSIVARALIAELLFNSSFYNAYTERLRRRPHLLTHEDPIEKLFLAPTEEQFAFDYTARDQAKGDATSLEDSLKDALRQTPAVVYVGELRDRNDYKDILKFASTGHLVISTAHCGSIQEAFSRFFESTPYEGIVARESVARSVKAIVHLQPATCSDKTKALLPSVWRQTAIGSASLVADGLSSIVPSSPIEKYRTQTSSFGRAWFADHIFDSARLCP